MTLLFWGAQDQKNKQLRWREREAVIGGSMKVERSGQEGQGKTFVTEKREMPLSANKADRAC